MVPVFWVGFSFDFWFVCLFVFPLRYLYSKEICIIHKPTNFATILEFRLGNVSRFTDMCMREAFPQAED